MIKKISQRDARQMRRRIEQLERMEELRNNAWVRDYPGGAHLYTLTVCDALRQTIRTARQLGHAVVVTLSSDGSACFHALKLEKQ